MIFTIQPVTIKAPTWEQCADEFAGMPANQRTLAGIRSVLATIDREIEISGTPATDDQIRALIKLNDYQSQCYRAGVVFP